MRYHTVQQLRANGEIKEKLKKELQGHVCWVYQEQEFWKLVAKFVQKDDYIVDLGCGGGLLANLLTEKFGCRNIHLIDLDDYRRPEAASFKFSQIDFNREAMPIADGVADIIFAIDVIEHLENPFYFVQECERILKPGGKLIMAMPNSWNIFSRLMFLLHGEIEGYKLNNNHISFFPKGVFGKLLKNFESSGVIYNRRWQGRFFPLRYIRLPYPKSEFFSYKVCYFFKKLPDTSKV